MTTSPTVAISVLLASAAAVAVSLTMRPEAAVAPTDANAELRLEVARLRETQDTLLKEIEALRVRPVQAPVGGSERVAAGLRDDQVAAAVEAYLQRRDDTSEKEATAPGDATATFDMEKDWKGLLGKNYWENPDLWKKAFASGRMDELIAKFEAMAAADPKNVASQMDLAHAYMAYLQLDQTKWQYSMKADGVFDNVLELDENHWEARFTKAVSYTFWPDFMGKRGDAIKHFERLVEQQEVQPAADHHAETYLYLGNLLEQSDPARAKQMWAKGAQRHPQHAELSKKAGS